MERFEAQQAATDTMLDALIGLSVARQAEFTEATQRVYLAVLRDVDAGCVAAACGQLAAEPREDYKPAMPEAGDIRQRAFRVAAELVEQEREAKLLPLPPRLGEEGGPRYSCLDCKDDPAGWSEQLWCHGYGDLREATPIQRYARDPQAPCDRSRRHPPHPYRRRCHCYGINPVVARHQKREADPSTKQGTQKRRSR